MHVGHPVLARVFDILSAAVVLINFTSVSLQVFTYLVLHSVTRNGAPLTGTWSVWVSPAASTDAYSHAVSVSYFGKYVCGPHDHKMPRNAVKRKRARSSPVFLTITDIREKSRQAGVSFSAKATKAQLSSLLAATGNPDSGPNPPETPPAGESMAAEESESVTGAESHSVTNILLSLQKSVDALTAAVQGSRGEGQQDPPLGHASQPGSTPASVGQTSDSLIPGRSSTAGTSQHQWGMGQFPWPCSPLAFSGSPMCGPGHSLESAYAKMGGITPSLPGKRSASGSSIPDGNQWGPLGQCGRDRNYLAPATKRHH